ncbi:MULTISPECIES: hypothetical protein [Klebsiella]|uniref:hypothetical protein n=1 Tax=Klebsiella TaxID=570 RepID=UPI00086348DC|nr:MULTISPECIES: hypothetical protein [Klebsiella]AOV13607.1 hypothetical protein BJF97_22315 [Klebsiella sp. LTGPAF-6F]MBD0965130.1 hypothetical protein [Klebsiella michiganensis]
MTNNQLTEEELQTLIIELQQTAYRLNGTNSAYLMSDAIKPLRELQERRKAAMDSEPVAWQIHTPETGVTYVETNPQSVENIRNGYGIKVEITPLYRHAQPVPVVVPEGVNPETTDLVLRFASALADKLYKAEQKYGRSTDWMKDDWYDDCLQSLWEHIEKGDPRDVAAYCAFMWWHGWSTKPAEGLESSTVTVKLPHQTDFDDPLSAYEAIEKCKEALTAAGIKWEAE